MLKVLRTESIFLLIMKKGKGLTILLWEPLRTYVIFWLNLYNLKGIYEIMNNYIGTYL